MGRPPKITGALREELWRRYKAGETVLGIGRALDRRQSTIHRLLQATGGIAPTHRSRSSRVLSFSEREEISRGVAAGSSFHNIARDLHRAVSTVARKWPGMADGRIIEPLQRTWQLGNRRVVQSVVCSPRTWSCDGS